MMNNFWMIYVDGKKGSTVKHTCMPDARVEAERLARLNPNTKVFVLKFESYCIFNPVIWHDVNDIKIDDIPF